MAGQRQSNKRDGLKEDELVRSLAPDPSVPLDARVIAGFLGKSGRERHWRLYLTPTLNDYVEFAEADVLHSRPLEGSDHPLGGTVVWVKREANIVHTRSASREAQADFLQGDIAARHLGAAADRRHFSIHPAACGLAAYVLGQSIVRCDLIAMTAPSFVLGGVNCC